MYAELHTPAPPVSRNNRRDTKVRYGLTEPWLERNVNNPSPNPELMANEVIQPPFKHRGMTFKAFVTNMKTVGYLRESYVPDYLSPNGRYHSRIGNGQAARLADYVYLHFYHTV
jgi:hypothetical protein